jgi:hypothetical protein
VTGRKATVEAKRLLADLHPTLRFRSRSDRTTEKK